jgi:hypothetical protein
MSPIPVPAADGKCMVRDLWVGAPTGVTGSDAQMYLVKFHAALQAAAGKKVVSDGNPRLIGGLVPPKVCYTLGQQPSYVVLCGWVGVRDPGSPPSTSN